MRVLAIDFETANGNSASACAIGYALMDNGEIIRSDEILIKPHPSVGYFNYGNVKIHGLTPDMVRFADDWPMVYWQIKDCFRDSVVVAHNAMFDIAVLRSINELYHIKMPDFTYVDTVSISRVIHPQLINHKLNTVCEYLGYELDHHHAGSDALGCIAIILDAMEIYDTYEINELFDVMYMKQHHYINK